MNNREFIASLNRLKDDGVDVAVVVRTALTSVLGELPATVVLSYTGDASDGDFQGFALRAEELLGGGSPVMFSNIISSAKKTSKPLVKEKRRA